MIEILNNQQIERKIKRIAYQIYENHFQKELIYLVGINNNGLAFAQLLKDAILSIADTNVELVNVTLNPAQPNANDVNYNIELEKLDDKNIILVDDVANSGRTLFYAAKPLLNLLPNSIEVAVLVDRSHKSFPIRADYVGLSIATTVNDNIKIDLKNTNAKMAYLA